MSVKYHISPSTGRPNKCSATKQCPYGGITEHYGSKEEARTAYEESMKTHTFSEEGTTVYVSPFGARERVRSKTVWSYDTIVADHGGFRHLKAAHPDLEFKKSPEGELVVTGPAKKVEAYIQAPDGAAGDINLSLSRLRSLDNKGKKAASQFMEPVKTVADEPVMDVVEETIIDEQEIFEYDSGTLDEPSIDDDWKNIKCDDCNAPLSNCVCHVCDDCGAYEDEEHENDCRNYKAAPKAYSWD